MNGAAKGMVATPPIVSKEQLSTMIQQMCASVKVETVQASGKDPRPIHLINYKEIAKLVLDPIDKELAVDVVVSLLRFSPEYVAVTKHVTTTYTTGSISKIVTVNETVLNFFMPVFEEGTKKKKNKKDNRAKEDSKERSKTTNDSKEANKEDGSSATDKNSKSRTRRIPVFPFSLTDDQKVAIVLALVSMELSVDLKVWNKVTFVFAINEEPLLSRVAHVFAESIRCGIASFCATIHAMHQKDISPRIDVPEAVLHGVLVGPLRATTVEAYCAGRSSTFRQRCRSLLLQAESTGTDRALYERLLSPAHRDNPNLPSHLEFARNVKALMAELRGDAPVDQLVHTGWACAALKKYARRYYEDKTWRLENLHELVWTILVQRPNLKKFVLTLFAKTHPDPAAYNFWSRFQPFTASRTGVISHFDTVVDPLAPDGTGEFLSFPPGLQPVDVVSTVESLRWLMASLEQRLASDGQLLIGLDVEWSAFVSHSMGASILQLAVWDQVFIIDLDAPALCKSNYLRAFFSRLFLEPRFIKLGFQFGEDLVQLRLALPLCAALYKPKRLYCVAALVTHLLELTEMKGDVDVTEFYAAIETAPAEVDETLETVTDSNNGDAVESGNVKNEGTVHNSEPTSDEQQSSSVETQKSERGVMQRGLSELCLRMLGKPLDKTEQCSVWDRRPLRALQIRYAALDAYCLLMLLTRCEQWAARLGVDVYECLAKQSDISVPLPLFYGDD